MKPLVSAIIPAFNAGATLARAIKSVLAQTYEAMEIIVIDDGSSDNTVDVANSFRSNGVKVIQTEYQSGAAATRNLGIEHARGEFIAFVDADDEWLPEKTAKQVETLNANPKAVFVACKAKFISEQPHTPETVNEGRRPVKADLRSMCTLVCYSW